MGIPFSRMAVESFGGAFQIPETSFEDIFGAFQKLEGVSNRFGMDSRREKGCPIDWTPVLFAGISAEDL